MRPHTTKDAGLRILIVVRRAGSGMAAGLLRIVQCAGGILALLGFLLFGSQCIEWLKTGIWISHSLKNDIWLGWPWPQVTWVGVQRIIDWLLLDLLSLPTALTAIITGGAIGGVAAISAHRLEERQRRVVAPRLSRAARERAHWTMAELDIDGRYDGDIFRLTLNRPVPDQRGTRAT